MTHLTVSPRPQAFDRFTRCDGCIRRRPLATSVSVQSSLYQNRQSQRELNEALIGCGGQDSNLRTDKEWDLNPPPLTKLGDPRADRWRGHVDFKPPMVLAIKF